MTCNLTTSNGFNMQRPHQPTWHTALALHVNNAPAIVRPWLIDKQSLTARLRCACPSAFRVVLLEEQWSAIPLSEQRALACVGTDYAYVRTVRLCCGDTPWVYARTVIPQHSLRGRLYGLTRLGNKPLGAVLFAEPTMRRGIIEIARITPDTLMYTDAINDRQLTTHSALWGRRSVFTLFGKQLLVNEIFLPDFFAHGATLER